jgi:hypothetical protein
MDLSISIMRINNMNRLKNYFSKILPSVSNIDKINPLSLKGCVLEIYAEYGFETVYTAFVQTDSIAVEDTLLIFVSPKTILIFSSVGKDGIFYDPNEEVILNLLSKIEKDN